MSFKSHNCCFGQLTSRQIRCSPNFSCTIYSDGWCHQKVGGKGLVLPHCIEIWGAAPCPIACSTPDVWWGRPRGRLHSFGGSLMPALRARVWSSSGSERMTWPKNLRRLSMTVWVTGGGLPGWWRGQWRGLVECVGDTTGRTRRLESLAGPHRHVPHFWAIE